MCDFLFFLWMFRRLCVKNWMEFCFTFPQSGDPREKSQSLEFKRELSCDLTTLCKGKSCGDYFMFVLHFYQFKLWRDCGTDRGRIVLQPFVCLFQLFLFFFSLSSRLTCLRGRREERLSLFFVSTSLELNCGLRVYRCISLFCLFVCGWLFVF